MEINELTRHISESPLVRAAITEAIHRFYHDRVLSPHPKDRQLLTDLRVSDILSTAWNLTPNWRYLLKTIPRRYEASVDTIDIPIINKPEHIVPLQITFTIQ